jgi:hypothetical protein
VAQQFQLNKRLTQRRPISRRSYREKAALLLRARDWMHQLDVKVSATRIGKYVKMLNRLADYHETRKIEDLRAEYGDKVLLNALSESDIVITIFEGLQTKVSAGLIARLKLFAEGRDLLFEETAESNNIARNTGFELEIAAAFAKANVPIDLERGDLSIQIDGRLIAVECNRPYSYAKLETNVRDASRQLIRRYTEHPAPDEARGIVSISVSKMENKGGRFLKVSRESELSPIVDGLFDKFGTEFNRVWATVRDARTVAVLLHLNAPAMVEDLRLLTMVRYFVMINLSAPTSENFQLVRDISDKLYYAY